MTIFEKDTTIPFSLHLFLATCMILDVPSPGRFHVVALFHFLFRNAFHTDVLAYLYFYCIIEQQAHESFNHEFIQIITRFRHLQ